jgi:SAF domain
VGIATMLVGSWVAAAIYMSAGNRNEVLVVANKVDRLHPIQRTDLRVVRISADTDAASVGAARIEEFIGRVASSDLAPGSLLAEAQLLPAGAKLLADSEAVVGLLLGPGDAQMNLKRGTSIVLVVRPAAGQTTPPVEVTGWVFNSSAEALSSRDRPIELAVPRDRAALVSAASADKRVTIVALGE